MTSVRCGRPECNSQMSFRVVEIAENEGGGWRTICRRRKEKKIRGIHSQNDTSHAVALFLHHGYEHNTRFFSLAKLDKRINYINMIYVRMFEFVVQN